MLDRPDLRRTSPCTSCLNIEVSCRRSSFSCWASSPTATHSVGTRCRCGTHPSIPHAQKNLTAAWMAQETSLDGVPPSARTLLHQTHHIRSKRPRFPISPSHPVIHKSSNSPRQGQAFCVNHGGVCSGWVHCARKPRGTLILAGYDPRQGNADRSRLLHGPSRL